LPWLHHGDYQSLLPKLTLAPDTSIVAFVAPPWGKVLDEAKGLDLCRTIPPITEIIRFFERTFPARRLLFAVQVYEKLDPASLAEVQALGARPDRLRAGLVAEDSRVRQASRAW
jgi:hypothetical protein